MIVVCLAIDVVDGVDDVHDVLAGDAFVGAHHHRAFGIALETGGYLGLEGTFADGFLFYKILILIVYINCNGLFGHGAAVA